MRNRKVTFPLTKDEDDYPPYAEESVWRARSNRRRQSAS